MNMNTTNIIEIKGLVKKYRKEKVLDIDTFSFVKGGCYLLVGANGSGKSTLIKLIVSLIKPTYGEINVYTNNIGYVPEKYTFPQYLTVYDFLDNLCKVKYKKDMKDKINYLLKWWNIEKNKKIKALSKGMKQKILIMQAIIEELDLYIFDEPLNGLDINSQNDFILMLYHLKMLGKTIIVSTHYEKYYQEFFDNYIYVKEGKIIAFKEFN